MSAPTEADLDLIIERFFVQEGFRHRAADLRGELLQALSGCWVDPETNTPRAASDTHPRVDGGLEDLLVDALCDHQWHPDMPMSAHKLHDSHAWCEVCQGDVRKIVRFILKQLAAVELRVVS